MTAPANPSQPVGIVLIGSFVPASQPGGVTTHCTRLAERLEDAPGCAVRRVNIKLRGPLWRSLLRSNPATWLLAVMRARLAGFRVFHFNTSARNIPFPALAPALRLLGARLVLSFHSGALSANLGKNGPFAGAIFRLSLALAHRVVFMNQRERDAIAARFPKYAPKFTVIHSFITPSRRHLAALLPPKNRAPISRPGDPAQPPKSRPYAIACMGAWLPYYLFEETIAVMERIAAAFPEQAFELRIACALFNLDPGYKKRIESEVARVNAFAENLRVIAEENVADPLAFLAAADLLVRSSSVDSFGLCVAEAIFLGKPAIATNVCRRVEGTLLYAPHDLVALETHIRLAHQRHRDGTQPPISLPESEDVFPKLLQLYREEAAR